MWCGYNKKGRAIWAYSPNKEYHDGGQLRFSYSPFSTDKTRDPKGIADYVDQLENFPKRLRWFFARWMSTGASYGEVPNSKPKCIIKAYHTRGDKYTFDPDHPVIEGAGKEWANLSNGQLPKKPVRKHDSHGVDPNSVDDTDEEMSPESQSDLSGDDDDELDSGKHQTELDRGQFLTDEDVEDSPAELPNRKHLGKESTQPQLKPTHVKPKPRAARPAPVEIPRKPPPEPELDEHATRFKEWLTMSEAILSYTNPDMVRDIQRSIQHVFGIELHESSIMNLTLYGNLQGVDPLDTELAEVLLEDSPSYDPSRMIPLPMMKFPRIDPPPVREKEMGSHRVEETHLQATSTANRNIPGPNSLLGPLPSREDHHRFTRQQNPARYPNENLFRSTSPTMGTGEAGRATERNEPLSFQAPPHQAEVPRNVTHENGGQSIKPPGISHSLH